MLVYDHQVLWGSVRGRHGHARYHNGEALNPPWDKWLQRSSPPSVLHADTVLIGLILLQGRDPIQVPQIDDWYFGSLNFPHFQFDRTLEKIKGVTGKLQIVRIMKLGSR